MATSPVWTVDTWKVKPRHESHFLKRCSRLSPDKLVLYRDLEVRNFFWSPRKWESRESLEEWRGGSVYKSAVKEIEGDVVESFTHIMEEVKL
ncbi:MAG TPA: hypothetical protein VJN21_00810 [Candidatus Acidoferrales bacterium]|nr:hypothetical protein [Candidatus Acidoferrales bacterium]